MSAPGHPLCATTATMNILNTQQVSMGKYYLESRVLALRVQSIIKVLTYSYVGIHFPQLFDWGLQQSIAYLRIALSIDSLLFIIYDGCQIRLQSALQLYYL